MIVIAVEFIVNPDHAEEFRGRVTKHAQNSLAEPGCVRFDVAEDSEQAGRFLIWENYVDLEAVDAHRAQPYLAEFRGFVDSIIISRKLSLSEMITPTAHDE